MSRKMFFWIVIVLMIMFFAACAQKANGPTATTVPPTATTPPSPTAASAYASTGASAPTATTPPPPTVTTAPIVIDTPIPIATTHTPLPEEPGAVAILVVDDFINASQFVGGGTPYPTPTGEVPDPTENCAYTNVGEQGYASTGAQAYASTGANGYASTGAFIPVLDENGHPIQHGVLVYDQISIDFNNMTTATQQTTITNTGMPWVSEISYWKMDNGYAIYLVPLDTDDYKTTAIRDRIDQTINKLSGDPYYIQRFVLNMSFVIMPCNLGIDSKWQKKETKNLVLDFLKVFDDLSGEMGLDNYIAMLNEHPEIGELKTVLDSYYDSSNNTFTVDETIVRNNLLYGPEFSLLRVLYFYNTRKIWSSDNSNYARIDQDPLKQWMETPPKNPDLRVISVAAAGNYGYLGYDYPFAPALWDSVVSVSANGWDPLDKDIRDHHGAFDPTAHYTTTKTTYSNPGEVIFNGQLNHQIRNPEADMYYFGTSFAAPRLSVQEAIHLLFGGDIRCFNSQGVELCHPPLGYATDYGPWGNLIFYDAVQNCPNFKTRP